MKSNRSLFSITMIETSQLKKRSFRCLQRM